VFGMSPLMSEKLPLRMPEKAPQNQHGV